MEPTALIDLRRYRHDDVTPELKQTLVAVHADAYADAMDDPFNQRFAWFVDHWSSNPGFSCVLGYDKDEPVGLAYGAAAVPQREWWREHWTPEGDSTTFALSELMVRPKWRKTGAGQQLHDALLEERTEALAVLLVDTTHPRVQRLYESWGYRKVGIRQPFADSPLYAVMLKGLQAP